MAPKDTLEINSDTTVDNISHDRVNGPNVAVCIPTLNAGSCADRLISSIKKQSLQPDSVLVVDSSSDDNTSKMFEEAGAVVRKISRCSFDHGGTRQLCVNMLANADVIVFMTQDVVLATPSALEAMVTCFKDVEIGAVCGRQKPAPDVNQIARHARIFNYPSHSFSNSRKDISRIGIKSAFLSNSFAAYRRSALMSVGGFPERSIFGEDTQVAAKMLLAGWKVAYRAEASVYHSHNMNYIEEFQRYFDIGVFHSRERWFIDSLGRAEGEGKRFVFSELKYLTKVAPWLIPSAGLRTILKYIGYLLGMREQDIPIWIKRYMSMNKGFWTRDDVV